MKPKTKLQNEVAALSESLPPISSLQKQWAYDKCLGYHAIQSRGKCYCVECGHNWKNSQTGSRFTCPSCGKRIHLLKGYKSPHAIEEYFAIITVHKGFQVIRIGIICKAIRNKKIVRWFVAEVMQHWISEKGITTALSIGINQSYYRVDAWNYGSKMEVKQLGSQASIFRHSVIPISVYPQREVLPIFRRNGFTGATHNIIPYKLLENILINPMAETLLKARQYSALHAEVSKLRNVSRYWPSLKICIRNNYVVKDFSIWSDYIDLIRHFKKDPLNAKYVCPENLLKEHDILLKRRKKQRELEEAIRRKYEHEKQMKEAADFQKCYEEQKGIFFDIAIKGKDITVIVLRSIEEFKNEGLKLNHCVFENGYYKKKKSLILSARLNENLLEPVETIEVSLESMQIIQSRGFHNKFSPHHDSIVQLVKKNINTIAARVAV